METITNIASTAATTASKLIYGDTTAQNETAGKEPISGEQGKGTASDPFDKGNTEDATAAATSLSDAKIEPTTPLEPTGAVREPKDLLNAYEEAAPNSTAPTTTAITDKVWQTSDVDAVKPSVTDPAAAPETGMGAPKGDLWQPAEVYQGSAETSTAAAGGEPGKVSTDKETAAITKLDSHEPKTTGLAESKAAAGAEKKDIGVGAGAGAAGVSGLETKPETKAEVKAEKAEAKAEEKAEKAESKDKKATSPSPSSDDDDKSKMSALKDKLKTKLHIGHKDK